MKVATTLSIVNIDYSYYVLLPKAVRVGLALHTTYQALIRYNQKTKEIKSITFTKPLSLEVVKQKVRAPRY